jgi:nucleotide-binding universal stress UspA family protein
VQYKNILVYLDQGASNPQRVNTAIAMARTHQARLTGVVVNAIPTGIALQRLGLGGGEDLLAKLRSETASIFSEFGDAVSAEGIEFDTRAIECRESRAGEELARLARTFDISILRQANPDRPDADFISEISEEVLFSSGRPVMFMPYIGAHGIPPRRGMIAWDGSAGAARAVHDALPLLEQMDEVQILTVDTGIAERDSGARTSKDLSAHLTAHGIANRVVRTHRGESTTSTIILNTLSDTGVDLLIMGAYGTPRLREVILGGVTRTLLSSMVVPVVMSH